MQDCISSMDLLLSCRNCLTLPALTFIFSTSVAVFSSHDLVAAYKISVCRFRAWLMQFIWKRIIKTVKVFETSIVYSLMINLKVLFFFSMKQLTYIFIITKCTPSLFWEARCLVLEYSTSERKVDATPQSVFEQHF